jgi:hypothetical protein
MGHLHWLSLLPKMLGILQCDTPALPVLSICIISLCVALPKVAKVSKAGIFLLQNSLCFCQQTLPMYLNIFETSKAAFTQGQNPC